MKVVLANVTQNPIEVIYKAYKICYSKTGQTEITMPKRENGAVDYEKMIKFIRKYMLMNHLSPLEHISFTFYIEGVSRALTHQLVRHRIASYNQQSQRYVDGNSFKFVIPPSIEKDEDAKEEFLKLMSNDMESYNKIVDCLIVNQIREKYPTFEEGNQNKSDIVEIFKEKHKSEYIGLSKKAYEDARYILPNATTTNITMTMNARTLRHFLGERMCLQAQWEIRDLAKEMLRLATDEIYFIAEGVMKCESCTDDKCIKKMKENKR